MFLMPIDILFQNSFLIQKSFLYQKVWWFKIVFWYEKVFWYKMFLMLIGFLFQNSFLIQKSFFWNYEYLFLPFEVTQKQINEIKLFFINYSNFYPYFFYLCFIFLFTAAIFSYVQVPTGRCKMVGHLTKFGKTFQLNLMVISTTFSFSKSKEKGFGELCQINLSSWENLPTLKISFTKLVKNRQLWLVFILHLSFRVGIYLTDVW